VALLVVGAFVFWPSGNLEREPIAENVERKDSTAQKKAAPSEVKNEEVSADENESSKTENEAQSGASKPPTTTSIDPVEIADKLIVEEGEAVSPEEKLAEIEMDFSDEIAEDQEVPVSESEVLAEEESKAESTPELAQSFSASDSSPASSNESITPKSSFESARSAATTSADLMKQGASFEGISLESIGGTDKNGYVAY
jgi:hypothetical protein